MPHCKLKDMENHFDKLFEEVPNLSDHFLTKEEEVKIPNKISDTINRLQSEVEESRIKVLKRTLEEKGIQVDIEKESQRRFKTLQMEVQGDKETYFYNDGSIEGKRIITFWLEESNPKSTNCNLFQMSFGYNLMYA